MKRLIAVLVGLVVAGGVSAADIRGTSAGEVRVTQMIAGLDEPWAIAFLDNSRYLITERGGRLLYVADGKTQPVDGVPEVRAQGQGGLLDIVAAKDFARSGEVFLSYSMPARGGAKTAVTAARFDPTGPRLTDQRVIFEMAQATGNGRHFGSRIVEAPDGTLFVTIGDRGDRDQAQNPNRHNGKVIRINRDGSVPADNPWASGGALPEIWSIGHRNAQGAALDEAGRFWTVSHGARGGDEINQPEAGKNYGWPVVSYGVHYSGARIGEGTDKTGMEQPLHYWDPSIAPSGMMIYSGKLFPDWRGDIFVGSLKFDMISRLDRNGTRVEEAERLFDGIYYRIRDIREAPDGSIWFLSVGDGAAYRMTPAG